MKWAAFPSPRMKDEAFKLDTCPVGPWGPAAVFGMATKPLGGLMLTLLTFVLPVTV
jgi:hypothetical protein